MDEIHRALGQFICAQNPYTNLSGEEGPPQKPKTGEMILAPDWQEPYTPIENGDYALLWEFGGKQRRVGRAVRIEYTYKATYNLPNGDTKVRDLTEHLLIGYEGSGGELQNPGTPIAYGESVIGDKERALGQFIYAQNPYTNLSGEEGPPQKPQTEEMILASDWQKRHTAIENGDYALFWEFGGKQHSVRRAVRIEYTYKTAYTLPKGGTKARDVTEHLLIGYEGSGGE